jgi:hypothetical protein
MQPPPRRSCIGTRYSASFVDAPAPGQAQLNTPVENRNAQTRTASTIEPTIPSHSL